MFRSSFSVFYQGDGVKKASERRGKNLNREQNPRSKSRKKFITYIILHILFVEIYTESRKVQGEEGIPAGNCFAILYWIDDVRGRGLLLS